MRLSKRKSRLKFGENPDTRGRCISRMGSTLLKTNGNKKKFLNLQKEKLINCVKITL